MDIFVKDGNMQPSVYPIDTIVSEQKVASRRVNVAHYMKTGRKLTVAQTRIDRNNHMCQVHRTTWNIPSLLLGTKVMSTASSQGRPVDSFEFLGGLGFWGISDVASYHGWRYIWRTVQRIENKVCGSRWVSGRTATESAVGCSPWARRRRIVETGNCPILRRRRDVIAVDAVDVRRAGSMLMMRTQEEEI